MKNTKVQWLCLIREIGTSGAREEQWVRGVLRPYRDGIKQSANGGSLVFFSTTQVEVLLKELPDWQVETGNTSVWVGIDTPTELGIVQSDYTWALINTQSDYTTGTRFNKYYGFTASTGTINPTNIEPPVTTMPDVIRLEQAEDNLRSTLVAANVILQNT